jgi:hypothetical protein
MELRDALAAVTRDLRLPAPETFDAVANALADALGPGLSPHARVRSVRDGTCVIEADAPAIASRVRYLVEGFTTRVNEAAGRPLVRTVNVVVKTP